MAQIRVSTGTGLVCWAICPELAGTTISLKDITAARNARRRGLARGLRERASVVDRLLAACQDQHPPGPTPAPDQTRLPPRPRRCGSTGRSSPRYHPTPDQAPSRHPAARPIRPGRAGRPGQPGAVHGHQGAPQVRRVRRRRPPRPLHRPVLRRAGRRQDPSARYYAGWDTVRALPESLQAHEPGPAPGQALASRSLVYTPAVANTPRTVDKGVTFYHTRLKLGDRADPVPG